jgi:N-acetylglucosaminyl-diphospho-decaprenol L-rhamnosyltransferase
MLEACLERLERFLPDHLIYVVDTAPDRAFLAELSNRYNDVQIIEAANHSLANAVNAGLVRHHTPFVAHMNADVYIEAETFDRLMHPFDNPAVAMTGPLFITGEGNRQKHGPLYQLNYWRLPVRGQRAVPWLSGALQVIRNSAIETVGGMDTSLRFYNEDVEWCYRLRQSGFQCLLVSTEVTHIGGSSTPDAPRFLVEGYRGAMQVSRRYRRPWFRSMHRLVVKAEASIRRRTTRLEQRRKAYCNIANMFHHKTFNESPFGHTLDYEKQ